MMNVKNGEVNELEGNLPVNSNSQTVTENDSELEKWGDEQLAKLVEFDDSPDFPLESISDDASSEEFTQSNDSNTVSQSELFDEPIEGRTPPRFSSRPFPKAAAIGSALLVVFGGGGLFLQSVMSGAKRKTPAIANSPLPQLTPNATPSPNTEVGNLKTQLALGNQENQIKDLERSKTPKTPNTKATKTEPTKTANSTPAKTVASATPQAPPTYPTRPDRERSTPASPRAIESPRPERERHTPSWSRTIESPRPTTPTSQPASTPAPTPSSEQRTVDPMQQWMALSQVGSFGTSSMGREESARNGKDIATNVSNSTQPQTGAKVVTMPRAVPVVSSTGGVPFNSIAQKAIVPAKVTQNTQDELVTNNSGSPLQPSQSVSQKIALNSESIRIGEPTSEIPVEPTPPVVAQINPSEEASILNGMPVRSLQVGTQAKAKLLTPLVWAKTDSTEGEKFVVQLSETMANLPQGTSIVFQVAAVSESGLVQLKATSLVVNGQEYTLPPGAISVRGQGGQPLIADKWGDKGPAIASRDVTAFLFGSLSKVGEVLNQPDVQQSINSSSGGFSSSTTTNNRRPNLLGAVLEGGFGPLTDQILQRNEQAIQEIMSRPNVWYIRAGRNVQVFVNQSFEL